MFAAKRLVNRAAAPWRMRALSSAEMVQDPVKVLTYPGSRVLEFTRPESGNVLTESVLNTVKTKMQLYSELPNVNVVLFTSASTEFFSSGLETRFLDEKERRKQLVQAATEASTLIAKADKETIAVVSGDVDASVFGVFATAKYRLGTETTKFSVRDLLEGRLPIGGGIAHHLISTGDHGLALARYLAVSGRVLTAHDLYTLGLVTHIVQQDSPEDTLAMALSDTHSEDDAIKAQQLSVVSRLAVKELLDSMHIYMGEVDLRGPLGDPDAAKSVEPTFLSPERIAEDMEEYFRNNRRGKRKHHVKKSFYLSKGMKLKIAHAQKVELRRRENAARDMAKAHLRQPGELDLLDHPVWNRTLLVEAEPLPLDTFFDSDEARERAEDLDDVLAEVAECFAADSVEECRRRVEAAARTAQGPRVGDWVGQNWAERVLERWDSISPELLKEWFEFTRKAAGKSLEDVYQMELRSV